MVRQPGDFDKRYPNPDKGGDKRTKAQRSEEIAEVRRILRKNEEKWTSPKVYELLRWKMRGEGCSHTAFKTVAVSCAPSQGLA